MLAVPDARRDKSVPQGLKPPSSIGIYATAEAVALSKA